MESTWHRNLKPSTTSLSEFGEDEQTIFKMRAGIMLTDESFVNICRYYQLHLRGYFEKKQTRCCDIFQKHKKKKEVCSKNINLEMAEMLRSKGHSVVLGWKFCHHCDEAAKKMEESSREENQIDDENVDYDNELEKEEKCNKLNESLIMFDISPLKSHGLQRRTQISMAQEKLERSYEKQEETAADILEISSPEFGSPTGS